jgi:hypothetical protein|tara:strand:- start:298 stop:474 length:177 start_codon:yes stop_codon:yes gene_type:complete
MDSKDVIILEISTVVLNLRLKIEALQAKVDELCKKTGGCDRVKAVNKELLLKKDKCKK